MLLSEVEYARPETMEEALEAARGRTRVRARSPAGRRSST